MGLEHDGKGPLNPQRDDESFRLSERSERDKLNRTTSEDVYHVNKRPQYHTAGETSREEALSVENRSDELILDNVPHYENKSPVIEEPESPYLSITQGLIQSDRSAAKSSYADGIDIRSDMVGWSVDTPAPLGGSSSNELIENIRPGSSSDKEWTRNVGRLNHALKDSDHVLKISSSEDASRLSFLETEAHRSIGRIKNDTDSLNRLKTSQRITGLIHNVNGELRKNLFDDEEGEFEESYERLRRTGRSASRHVSRLKHRSDVKAFNKRISEYSRLKGRIMDGKSTYVERPYRSRLKFRDEPGAVRASKDKFAGRYSRATSYSLSQEFSNDFKRRYQKKKNRELYYKHKQEYSGPMAGVLNLVFKKKKRKAEKEATKAAARSVLAPLLPVIIVSFLVIIAAAFVTIFAYVLSSSLAAFTSPNDISTLSGTSDNMQTNVAELEYYLTDPEGIEEYRQMIVEEIFPETEHEIDEWEWIVPEDYLWNVQELVAYFSAKYHTYDIEMVSSEISEIFDEWFTKDIWLETQERERVENGVRIKYKYYIGHVIVTKNDLSAIIKERADALPDSNQYYMFLESNNGQQTYGPVMQQDWSKLVTSGFGPRKAPKTNQGYGSSYHGGVDIGIPVGTILYSPINGTIECLNQPSGAGLYVKITGDDGWSVFLMHLSDNTVVPSGSKVLRGQPVALSGNTGNSSGPHLHLEIRDPEGNKYDPRFYVPSTSGGLTEKTD